MPTPSSCDAGSRRTVARSATSEILAEHGFRYDIILLSSGEDGHVGALYPDHHSVADQHHGFIVMDDSPKPPPERMTSSLSLMQTAEVALLLFVGEAKREAYERFNDPTRAGCRLPGEVGAGDQGCDGFHGPDLAEP